VDFKSPDEFVGAVNLFDVAVDVLERKVKRIAPVGGAQDGATQMGNTPNPLAGEADKASIHKMLGHEQAIETIANTTDLPASIEGRNGDGPDDGVEAGGVTTPGTNGDAFNGSGRRDHAVIVEQNLNLSLKASLQTLPLLH